jgi:TRAP-type C4-dicarboxylate transport system permease large subunit
VRGIGWVEFKAALHETLRISAAIFLILIGAEIFGYLLSVSQITWQLVDTVRAMGLEPWQVLVLILLFFVLFGCIMDSLAMILLTVPLLYPLIIDSGFDPIWFGIIVVRVTEMGLITPPVGMNLFVIRSVAPELPLKTIFLGTLPFVLADMVRLALLVAMPMIVLWLPTQLGMI